MEPNVINLDELKDGEMVVAVNNVHSAANLRAKENDQYVDKEKDATKLVSNAVIGDVKGMLGLYNPIASTAGAVFMAGAESTMARGLAESYGIASKESKDELNHLTMMQYCKTDIELERLQKSIDKNMAELNQCFKEVGVSQFDYVQNKFIDLQDLQKSYNQYFQTDEFKECCKQYGIPEYVVKDHKACSEFLQKLNGDTTNSNVHTVLEQYCEQFEFVQKSTPYDMLKENSTFQDCENRFKALCIDSGNPYLKELAKRGFDPREIAKVKENFFADLNREEQIAYANYIKLKDAGASPKAIANAKSKYESIFRQCQYQRNLFNKAERDSLAYQQHNIAKKANQKASAKVKQLALRYTIPPEIYQGVHIYMQMVSIGKNISGFVLNGPLSKTGENIGKAVGKTKTHGKTRQAVRNMSTKVSNAVKKVEKAINNFKPVKKIRFANMETVRKTNRIKRKVSNKVKNLTAKFKTTKAGRLITKSGNSFKRIGNGIKKGFSKVKGFIAKSTAPLAKVKAFISKWLAIVAFWAFVVVIAIFITGITGGLVSDGFTMIGGDIVLPEEEYRVLASDFDYDIVQWANKFSEAAYYKKINEFCAENEIGTFVDNIEFDSEAGKSKWTGYAQYKDYNIAYYDCGNNRLDGFHSNMKDIVAIAYAYVSQGKVAGIEITDAWSDESMQAAIDAGRDPETIVTAYDVKCYEYFAMQYLITALWEKSNILTLEMDDNGQPYIKWTSHYLTSVEMTDEGYPVRYKDGEIFELLTDSRGSFDNEGNCYTAEELDSISSVKFEERLHSDGRHGLCHCDGSSTSGCLLDIYTNNVLNKNLDLSDYTYFYTDEISPYYFDNEVINENTLREFDFIHACWKIEQFYNYMGEGFTGALVTDQFVLGTYGGMRDLSLIHPKHATIDETCVRCDGYSNIDYYNYRQMLWGLMDAEWKDYDFYNPTTFYSSTLTDGQKEKALNLFFNYDNFSTYYKEQVASYLIDDTNISLLTVNDEYQLRFAIAYWALNSVGNVPYYDICDDIESYKNALNGIPELKSYIDTLNNQTTYFNPQTGQIEQNTVVDKMYSYYRYQYLGSDYKNALGDKGIDSFKDYTMPFPSIKGHIGSTTPGLDNKELIWWIYESATSATTPYYYGNNPIMLGGAGFSLHCITYEKTASGEQETMHNLYNVAQLINLDTMKPGDILITDDGQMAIFIGFNSTSSDKTGTPWIVMMSEVYMNSSYMIAISYGTDFINISNGIDMDVTFTKYVSVSDIMTIAGVEDQSLLGTGVSDFLSKYVTNDNATTTTLTYSYLDATTGKTVSGSVDAVQDISNCEIINVFYDRSSMDKYKGYLDCLNSTVPVDFDIYNGFGLILERYDNEGNLICNYKVTRTGETYTITQANGYSYTVSNASELYRNVCLDVEYTVKTITSSGRQTAEETIVFTGPITLQIGSEFIDVTINIKDGYVAAYDYYRDNSKQTFIEENITETTTIQIPGTATDFKLYLFREEDELGEGICEEYSLTLHHLYSTPTYPLKDYVLVDIISSANVSDIYVTSGDKKYDNPSLIAVCPSDETIIEYYYNDKLDFISTYFEEDKTVQLPDRKALEFKNNSGSFVIIDLMDKNNKTIASIPITPGGTTETSAPVGTYTFKHKGNIETIEVGSDDLIIELK